MQSYRNKASQAIKQRKKNDNKEYRIYSSSGFYGTHSLSLFSLYYSFSSILGFLVFLASKFF